MTLENIVLQKLVHSRRYSNYAYYVVFYDHSIETQYVGVYRTTIRKPGLHGPRYPSHDK